jgi:hypothetical protein
MIIRLTNLSGKKVQYWPSLLWQLEIHHSIQSYRKPTSASSAVVHLSTQGTRLKTLNLYYLRPLRPLRFISHLRTQDSKLGTRDLKLLLLRLLRPQRFISQLKTQDPKLETLTTLYAPLVCLQCLVWFKPCAYAPRETSPREHTQSKYANNQHISNQLIPCMVQRLRPYIRENPPHSCHPCSPPSNFKRRTSNNLQPLSLYQPKTQD